MAYTQVTTAGYNSSPPPDDGTDDLANRIAWSKIKSSLFDPIKSAIEAMNSNIVSAINTADNAVNDLEDSVTTLSTNIDNLATALGAPNGTAKLFRQTTPPTGWSKVTSFDDYALRLVTGTASGGGSTAFSSIFTSRTITTSNLPAHTHSYSDSASLNMTGEDEFLFDVQRNLSSGASAGGGATRVTDVQNNNVTVEADFPAFSITSGSAGSGSAWDFAIQYVDTICATKS